MLELDLRIPVANWLLARGLSPVLEAYSLRNCDMIGAGFDENKKLNCMVAVELKLVDVPCVIRQCQHHLQLVNESWAAMPPISKKQQARFVDVGLLQVEGGFVTVIRPATVTPRTVAELRRWHSAMRRRRDEHKWRMLDFRMRRDEARRISREMLSRDERL